MKNNLFRNEYLILELAVSREDFDRFKVGDIINNLLLLSKGIQGENIPISKLLPSIEIALHTRCHIEFGILKAVVYIHLL